MVDQADKTESFFWAALEIESRQGRAACLDEACGGDRQLRVQIDEMLAAHPKLVDFLERPPDATIDQPITEKPGTVIGRYKLHEQIGEGGFGLVYVAEQTQPVRRKMALKLIKPGMDSKEVIARFEAERQALALMDHPSRSEALEHHGHPARRPAGPQGDPVAVRFCPDGLHVLAKNRDEDSTSWTYQLWNVDRAKPIGPPVKSTVDVAAITARNWAHGRFGLAFISRTSVVLGRLRRA